MAINWNGVFPAVTTKFTENDELDLALFEINIKAQITAGVHGIIVGGSLGEASTLTFEEKKTIVQKTAEIANGKVEVILGIAEGSTHDAVAYARLANNWGATGLMLLPPMRYKSDERETVTFFKTVANATSLPILIYNNPYDYKIEVTLNMFEELADCANIEAVKESTRDITNVTRMKNRFGDRFKILCGVDTLAMEELQMGADGWIAGLVCAFPVETVTIFNLVKAGKSAEALPIYRWFMPLLELDIHSKLVQYIKLCEAQVGLGSEIVRAPRLTIIGEERDRVLKIINNALKNRPELSKYV